MTGSGAASRSWFAPCALGLAEVLCEELAALGATDLEVRPSGVSFAGPPEVARAACLWSRVAIRIQEPLAVGRVRGPDDLYELARQVRWQELVPPGLSFAVFASVQGNAIRHSRFAALRVKDAVVDAVRDATGRRPSVDTDAPQVPLKLAVRHDEARLYRDLAGDSLHRRGWRPVQVKSPLNEALAAGLLRLAGFEGKRSLCDPMCGSATLLIEAAHLAGDRAPGLRRGFAFEHWPDHEAGPWRALQDRAEQRWAVGRANIGPLLGADRHSGAIEIARHSARQAEVAGLLDLRVSSLADLDPGGPELVVVNPPWGRRLEDPDLALTWRDLGAFLKHRCPGAEAWVLSGDRSLTAAMHLKSSRRIPVRNGSVDCRWLQYRMRPGRAPPTPRSGTPRPVG